MLLDEDELTTCSAVTSLNGLSGSARTDYKSSHTYIEKNLLKRRQKDFVSMSVNNLTLCNLSAVKKHKSTDILILIFSIHKHVRQKNVQNPLVFYIFVFSNFNWLLSSANHNFNSSNYVNFVIIML